MLPDNARQGAVRTRLKTKDLLAKASQAINQSQSNQRIASERETGDSRNWAEYVLSNMTPDSTLLAYLSQRRGNGVVTHTPEA